MRPTRSVRRGYRHFLSRVARFVRGVERSHLQPAMIRRAKNEETFPRDSYMINPSSTAFNTWSVTMMPFLAYVAIVTPFEIAFVERGCTLVVPNAIVDIYFWMDLFFNFNNI